ncbi:hypothetical protein ACLM5H_12700 [Fredinandcohnia humi]
MMFKILDCTLRDGGYYTDWDFNRDLVDLYLHTISSLPIDIVEIGYRSPSKESYFGEYFYLPINTIKRAREKLNSNQEIAVMINSKDINSTEELEKLLTDCKGIVDMVRFASAPNSINHSVELALKAKSLGFAVALNIMYLSKLTIEDLHFINSIDGIVELDYLYLVDSYGACYPTDIAEKFSVLSSSNTNIKYGFHGHDNMELAFGNTIEAINSGAIIVDSTITGMGRGAGNLKTELISIYKSNKYGQELLYDNLVELVDKFNGLKEEYKWGASLPYIISGMGGLPQNEVMNLMSKQRYSTLSIIESIKKAPQENGNLYSNYQELDKNNIKGEFQSAIIVGGGKNLLDHTDSIVEFAKMTNSLIINSTIKNCETFIDYNLKQLVCLPGDERSKLHTIDVASSNLLGYILTEKTLNSSTVDFDTDKVFKISILSDLKDSSNEIDEDAPLAMAITTAYKLGIKIIYLAGFDGYRGITLKESYLLKENQLIINSYNDKNNEAQLKSLTPTLYNIERMSIYDLLGNKLTKTVLI